MKKTMFTLFIACFAFVSYGQRHIKGLHGFDVGGGLTLKGYYGNGGYIRFLSDKSYLKIGLLFEDAGFQSGDEESSIKSYLFNAAFDYNLFSIGDRLYVQAGLNLLTNVNRYGGTLIESQELEQQYFNVGFAPELEVELYLSNRIALFTNAKQAFFLRKELRKDEKTKVFYAGTGLRFILNSFPATSRLN